MTAMNAKMEISTALEDRTTSATWEDLGEPTKKKEKNLNNFYPVTMFIIIWILNVTVNICKFINLCSEIRHYSLHSVFILTNLYIFLTWNKIWNKILDDKLKWEMLPWQLTETCVKKRKITKAHKITKTYRKLNKSKL